MRFYASQATSYSRHFLVRAHAPGRRAGRGLRPSALQPQLSTIPCSTPRADLAPQPTPDSPTERGRLRPRTTVTGTIITGAGPSPPRLRPSPHARLCRQVLECGCPPPLWILRLLRSQHRDAHPLPQGSHRHSPPSPLTIHFGCGSAALGAHQPRPAPCSSPPPPGGYRWLTGGYRRFKLPELHPTTPNYTQLR